MDQAHTYQLLVNHASRDDGFRRNWCKLYKDNNIPFQFREELSDWILQQNWVRPGSDLYAEFVREVETKCRRLDDKTALTELKKRFDSRHAEFISAMANCLATELKWGLSLVERNTPTNESFVNELKKSFERHRALAYQQRVSLQSLLTEARETTALCTDINSSIDDVQQALHSMDQDTRRCLEALCRWREISNYLPRTTLTSECGDLNGFQKLFMEAYDCLTDWETLTRDFAQLLTERLGNTPQFSLKPDELHQALLELKKMLCDNCLVMEENLPQTIQLKGSRTGRRDGDEDKNDEKKKQISCVIRCLLPQQLLNVSTIAPTLHNLNGQEIAGKVSFGELTISTAEQLCDRLVCKSLKLDKVKPVEGLYYIHFTVPVEARSLEVQSNPFEFYSHTTQIWKRAGHVLWHNAFTPVLSGCKVNANEPREVPWSDLKAVLDAEFHQPNSVLKANLKAKPLLDQAAGEQPGQEGGSSPFGFNALNFRCLATMLKIEDSQPNAMVTKDAFIRDKVADFTFWEWFVACFLTKTILRNVYDQKLIYGFLRKEDADALLREKNDGTFLLRFSTKFLENPLDSGKNRSGYKLGYISPSNPRGHGKPIRSTEYKETYFGRIVMSKLAASDFVLGRDGGINRFSDSFADFMSERDVPMEGYCDLANFVDETPTTPRSECDQFSPTQSPMGNDDLAADGFRFLQLAASPSPQMPAPSAANWGLAESHWAQLPREGEEPMNQDHQLPDVVGGNVEVQFVPQLDVLESFNFQGLQ